MGIREAGRVRSDRVMFSLLFGVLCYVSYVTIGGGRMKMDYGVSQQRVDFKGKVLDNLP